MSDFEEKPHIEGARFGDPLAEERMLQGLLDGDLPADVLGAALSRLERDPGFRERLLDLVIVRAMAPTIAAQLTAPPRNAACAAARAGFAAYRSGAAEGASVASLSRHLDQCGSCRLAYAAAELEAEVAEYSPAKVPGVPPVASPRPRARGRFLAGVASVAVAVAAWLALVPSGDVPSAAPAVAPAPSATAGIAWDAPQSRLFASSTAIHRIFARWDARSSGEIEALLEQIANEPDPGKRGYLYYLISKHPGGVSEDLAWPLLAVESDSPDARRGVYSILPMEVTDAAALRAAISSEWESGEKQNFSNLLSRLPSVGASIPEQYFADLFDQIYASESQSSTELLCGAAVTLYYCYRNQGAICERLAAVSDQHPDAIVRSTANFMLAGHAYGLGNVSELNLRLLRLLPGLNSEVLTFDTHARVSLECYADPNFLMSLLSPQRGMAAPERSYLEDLLQQKTLGKTAPFLTPRPPARE
jgi:hypothetical protein